MFQCFTYASCERSIRRGERSFRCSIPRAGSRGRRLPPRGRRPPNPPGLGHGMFGQNPCRSSIESARLERVHSAKPCAQSWPRARPRISPGLPSNKDAKLTHAAQSPWGEIDTVLRGPSSGTGDTSERHLACSRNSLCRPLQRAPPTSSTETPAETEPCRSPLSARALNAIWGKGDFSARSPRPPARPPLRRGPDTSCVFQGIAGCEQPCGQMGRTAKWLKTEESCLDRRWTRSRAVRGALSLGQRVGIA
jgi:hypothetical protein